MGGLLVMARPSPGDCQALPFREAADWQGWAMRWLAAEPGGTLGLVMGEVRVQEPGTGACLPVSERKLKC